MAKGTLVIIEGNDGSGKGTQLQMLAEYCQTHAIPFESFDFPQYDKTFFGKLCGQFLRGDFGKAEAISPYLISLPYAADRWQAKKAIETALSEGKVVCINRYVPSNAVYQAAKLPPEQRDEFITWNFQLEYEEFGIPKEDLVIYLHVPVATSQQLINQKEKRGYLNGKKMDINEENIGLLRTTEELYESFCEKFAHWVCIDCAEEGIMRSKESIHEAVVSELKKKKIFL